MSAPRPNLDLHIDELVLHGFPPEQRRAIGAALERELARLLGERSNAGALIALGATAHLDAGAFTVDPGGSPQRIGASVARAVYEGLSRGPGPSPRATAPDSPPPSPARGAR